VNRTTVSGGELAYHDVGSGSAVLLLHGFPLSSHLWRALIPALAGAHRVIAPDLLGLGESEKPPNAALDIRAQAGYMRELLAQLEIDRLAVVGHSTGGGIAQLLAGDPGVETLILIDTIAFDAWPSQATTELQVAPPDRETFETIELVMRTAFTIGMYDAALSLADFETYLAPWRGDDVVPAFFRWARAIDGVGLRELTPVMAAWEMPTLLLWGEEDPFHPVAIAEELQEAIASSALGLVPECGHFLPEEAPETIFPIIAEYLRANYRKEPHGHMAGGPVLIPLEMPRDFLGLDDEDEDDADPTVAADQEVGPNA
jgi:pimeloyl-ACP methyl ester carboxylesterase